RGDSMHTCSSAVSEEISSEHAPFAVVRPRRSAPPEDLADMVAAERRHLDELLLRHGAILLRGFGDTSADDLSRVVAPVGGPPVAYFAGISPRTRVARDVYTSTELPPAVRIPLHSELAYLDAYPRHLWFACVTPAPEGGETWLADNRTILREIDPTVRERF